MIAFIACALALGVLAAALLSRPLWWPASMASGGLTGEVASLSQQLRQLDALRRSGALTDDQHAQSKALVERKLVAALGAPSDGAPARPSPVLTTCLVLFMFVVAGAGYALLGSPRDLEVQPGSALAQSGDAAAAGDAASAPHQLTAEQIAGMVDRLAEKLKTRPDDAEGWVMLARSYVAIGKHAQAVEAFAHASALRPADADLYADYADALAMAHQRNLEGEPTQLIDKALKLDAKNTKALALAGTAAFDRKDYAGAVHYWETLVQVEPPDGPFASQVQGGIAEARRLAGMPPAPAASASARAQGPAAPSDASPASANAARVGGTVTLAAAWKDRVSPDDTVFVFARAAQGPRMPLAILRKQVRDLPLQFTLDDSMAMSPASALSSVSQVVVGARISKSGNATPQPGDLQGLVSSVAVGTTGLKLEINEEVAR